MRDDRCSAVMRDSTTRDAQQYAEVEVSKRNRWLRAAVLSAVVTASWFTYVNWDGCWFYMRGIAVLTMLLFVWLWFLLFFGGRLGARVVLIGLALIVMMARENILYSNVAEKETRAVRNLRELKSSLELYKDVSPQHGYPERLPENNLEYSIRRLYRFAYTPNRSPDGSIRSYRLDVTPIRPECGCIRRFAIADDGQIHYTAEPRVATVKDPLLS